MDPTKKFSVMIVGCGNIAGGFDNTCPQGALPLTHAGAYQRHGGFSLAACVDPDEDKRMQFAARWNIPLAVPTLEALPDNGRRFDVISICSPTACHTADIEAVLRLRPSLIFCEKPVTANLAATKRLVNECATHGIKLAVNHLRRWAPDVLSLKDELDTGLWGKVRSVQATYNKGILNNGSHMLDLLALLFGPLKLKEVGKAQNDFFETDPTVAAMLSSKSGIPIMLGVGHAADYACFELQIVAERGVIQMENGGQSWRLRRPEASSEFAGYSTLGIAERRSGEISQAMMAAVANLHNALLSGSPLLSDGTNAVQAQALCEAIAMHSSSVISNTTKSTEIV